MPASFDFSKSPSSLAQHIFRGDIEIVQHIFGSRFDDIKHKNKNIKEHLSGQNISLDVDKDLLKKVQWMRKQPHPVDKDGNLRLTRKGEPWARKSIQAGAHRFVLGCAHLPEEIWLIKNPTLKEKATQVWIEETLAFAKSELPGRFAGASLHVDEESKKRKPGQPKIRPHLHIVIVPMDARGHLSHKKMYGFKAFSRGAAGRSYAKRIEQCKALHDIGIFVRPTTKKIRDQNRADKGKTQKDWVDTVDAREAKEGLRDLASALGVEQEVAAQGLWAEKSRIMLSAVEEVADRPTEEEVEKKVEEAVAEVRQGFVVQALTPLERYLRRLARLLDIEWEEIDLADLEKKMKALQKVMDQVRERLEQMLRDGIEVPSDVQKILATLVKGVGTDLPLTGQSGQAFRASLSALIEVGMQVDRISHTLATTASVAHDAETLLKTCARVDQSARKGQPMDSIHLPPMKVRKMEKCLGAVFAGFRDVASRWSRAVKGLGRIQHALRSLPIPLPTVQRRQGESTHDHAQREIEAGVAGVGDLIIQQRKEIGSLNSRLETAESRVHDLNHQVNDRDGQIASLTTDVQRLTGDVKTLKEALDPTKEALIEKNGALEALTSKKETLEGQVSDLTEKNSALSAYIETVDEHVKIFCDALDTKGATAPLGAEIRTVLRLRPTWALSKAGKKATQKRLNMRHVQTLVNDIVRQNRVQSPTPASTHSLRTGSGDGRGQTDEGRGGR